MGLVGMTLRQKQSLFVKLVGRLIEWAYGSGYELTFGDAYRDPRVLYGHIDSVHRKRLGIDFNLFKDGKYLDKTEDHLPLGKHWEALHPLCRWGGRFEDGNHYSLEHEGMK